MKPIPDPYALLGVAPDANDEAIRAAYHARVRASGADPALNAAWLLVRDEGARQRHRWSDPLALVAPPPAAGQAGPPPDAGALVRELAFLSEWELGNDDG